MCVAITQVVKHRSETMDDGTKLQRCHSEKANENICTEAAFYLISDSFSIVQIMPYCGLA